MSNKELDFISYNKITSKSDAFVISEELNCFVQYLPSTRATSYNIKKEQHTAGTTADFQDYSIPDVSLKISPKRLRRINPFNKNTSESLLLNKFNTDPDIIYPTVVKEIRQKEVDYSHLMLNPDQLEFLKALQNIRNFNVKENDNKLNIEEFSVIDEKIASSSFEIDPRYTELIVGKASGNLGSYAEELITQTPEDNQIQDYIKKFGFNPNDVTVKKKFEVRTGNSKDRSDVNDYLQVVNNNVVNDSPRTNIVNNLSSQNKSDYNFLNVTVNKSSGNLSYIRNAQTNNYRHELNFSNNTEISNFKSEIKVSNNSLPKDLNLDDIHKKLLDGLNQTSSKNEFNYFTQVKSAKNYNIFEFKDILNLTEKVSNNTNYVSLSTYYDHYRTINNNYNQVKNDLNFINNQVDYLTKINFNNKNTINKLYNTQNTYRNSILNMINNITKVQKLVYNENDFNFKAGLIKTITNLNRTNTYQITQLREQLNLANINMTFMNQRMFRYEVSKIEQTKKELNNILNVFDENGFVSNTFINKLSSTFKDRNFIELLDLSIDEKHIQNITYLLKQSTANIHAVKNVIDLVNLSKENNFQIEKFNSNSISNVNKILNLTKNTNNLLSTNKTSQNIFVSNQENLSQEQINKIQQNQNILKNINLSQFTNSINTLTSYSSQEINNAINLVNVLSKDIKLSNINLTSNDLKSLNLITEKIEKNSLTVKKISRLSNVNIEDIEQISENTNIQQETINKINLLSSEFQKISNQFSVSNKEIKQTINNTNVSENKNSYRVAQNVQLTNQQVRSLLNLSQTYNQKTTLLQNISEINVSNLRNIQNISNKTDLIEKINFVSNNLHEYKTKLSSENINQIFQNLNVFTENKSEIKKISRVVNNRVVQNLDQSFVDNVSIFQTKISNFADKSKLKETIENLNITTKNVNNIFSTTKLSQIIRKTDLKENIEQINIFESGKNSTVINKYSFESNKKNIKNLYSELNLVNETKIEKRTSQNISQIYNELNQTTKDIKTEIKSLIRDQRNIVRSTNNFVKAVSKSQNLGQQNLYDFLNFSNYSSVNKTSNAIKYGDYNQVYNLLNITKFEQNKDFTKSVKRVVNETIRLTKKTENISFDIHKVSNEKVYRVINNFKSTTNNYHEQREVEQKQEKLIEKKVDQLLTNKIETVTNSLVKNVLTKNEFDSIKRDIVYEILKIQNSTDEKIEQIKRETQQTVQNMLEKFLRS
jgi:hypothetical protein